MGLLATQIISSRNFHHHQHRLRTSIFLHQGLKPLGLDPENRDDRIRQGRDGTVPRARESGQRMEEEVVDDAKDHGPDNHGAEENERGRHGPKHGVGDQHGRREKGLVRPLSAQCGYKKGNKDFVQTERPEDPD